MPFTNNPYTTLADVKLAASIPTTDTDSDAWINKLIVQAQAYLDREIGYSFQTDGTVSAPAQRICSGTGRDTLFIPSCIQVIQVLETIYNIQYGVNGVWTGTSPTVNDITVDLMFLPDNKNPFYMLSRLSGSPFVFGKQNYQVSGIFGQPTIPPEITYACTILTIHYLKKRDSNYSTWIYSSNNLKQKMEKAVPEDVVEIIRQYKRTLALGR